MSSKYTVNYSAEAQDDILGIYNYIAYELNSENAAKNQVNRIRDVVRNLNSMPERYSIVDWEPWLSMGMRKVPVDRYVVFYLIDSDNSAVTIIRVFYSGRDIVGIVNEIND